MSEPWTGEMRRCYRALVGLEPMTLDAIGACYGTTAPEPTTAGPRSATSSSAEAQEQRAYAELLRAEGVNPPAREATTVMLPASEAERLEAEEAWSPDRQYERFFGARARV